MRLLLCCWRERIRASVVNAAFAVNCDNVCVLRNVVELQRSVVDGAQPLMRRWAESAAVGFPHIESVRSVRVDVGDRNRFVVVQRAECGPQQRLRRLRDGELLEAYFVGSAVDLRLIVAKWVFLIGRVSLKLPFEVTVAVVDSFRQIEAAFVRPQFVDGLSLPQLHSRSVVFVLQHCVVYAVGAVHHIRGLLFAVSVFLGWVSQCAFVGAQFSD